MKTLLKQKSTPSELTKKTSIPAIRFKIVSQLEEAPELRKLIWVSNIIIGSN